MSLVGELTGAETPPGRSTSTCRIVMDEVEGRGPSDRRLVRRRRRRGRRPRRRRAAGAHREGRRGCPFSQLLRNARAPRCTSRPASPVTLDELAAARRTHKAFGPEPVDRETLLELFELAQLAPNHHLTQPWRFRVLGPETLARLKEAGGPVRGAEARPRADARRRVGRALRRASSRTRRTSARPRRRSRSCCSARRSAASRRTGGRPASCAPRAAARRAACRTASACSG